MSNTTPLDRLAEVVARMMLTPVADALIDVVRAAGDVLRYDEGDGGSRLILEADLQRMQTALAALDAAIEKEVGE